MRQKEGEKWTINAPAIPLCVRLLDVAAEQQSPITAKSHPLSL